MAGEFIKELTVGGFRGFAKNGTLRLAVPSGAYATGLTVLVGPNNAGKSSVLEVLKLPSNQRLSEFGRVMRNSAYGDRCSVKHKLSTGATHELRSTSAGTYETEWLPNVLPLPNQIYTVPARRSLEAFFSRGVWSRTNYSDTSAEMQNDRNNAVAITPRLIQIAEDKEQKAKFDTVVADVLGYKFNWTLDKLETSQYVFEIDSPTGRHVNDGLGFGILSVLHVVAGLFDAGEASIVLIDEPELSMHPQIQRRVGEYIAEQSATTQIVVSTHSPYFADPRWFAVGAVLARCFVANKSSRIAQLSAATCTSIAGLIKDLNNPHVLGLDAREVFFAEEGVLVVEGQEDVILLQRIADQLKMRLPHTFFGWGAGGADKMKLILHILNDLGFKSVTSLTDKDKAAVSTELQKLFPKFKHFVLPADDIRDKPARTVKKKLGVCESDGKLKAGFVGPMTTLFRQLGA